MRQIRNYVRNACHGRGPFAQTVQTLQTGGKVPEKKLFAAGKVSMGRDSQPETAFMIVLEEAIKMGGKTAIQY